MEDGRIPRTVGLRWYLGGLGAGGLSHGLPEMGSRREGKAVRARWVALSSGGSR